MQDELPNAGIPADHGLTSLGLVMQLGGSLLSAGAALLAFVSAFALTRGDSLWLFVILAVSVVRSLYHRMAGTELLYGRRNGFDGNTGSPLAGIHRYMIAAAAHTLLVAAILKSELHESAPLVLGVALGLLAWPLVLGALFVIGPFKRFGKQIPVSEDKGFEGAAILMTMLGACGALATTAIFVVLFQAGSEMQDGRSVLAMLALVMLVVRSCLHVQAGMAGLRETSIDRSVELANRYASFGVISAFCAGAVMLLVAITSHLNLAAMVGVAAACWLLMAWPMIIRRFFSDRQFADLLAGENATLHRRAPDAGLTGLGWLLLAHATFGASFLIPQLFSRQLPLHQLPFHQLFDMFGSSGLRSPWWNAGLIMLEAWAGFEMIRMSRHHRAIATIYGVVSAAVTLWVSWPVFDEIRHAHHVSLTNPEGLLMVTPLAIALVIPAATLFLVGRNIAPTARARFRTRTSAPKG